ncbi:hypothetical protein BDW22DRAFT_1355322 [Trametopsis cervina]|nr:hypothetical protein BDW22DRAFT_1355322 [Trametopsis cervina]
MLYTMKFFTCSIPLLAAFAPAMGTPLPSPFMGTINAPTSSATVSGESFPFSYTVNNWCEEGYNNYKVFAVEGASPPTFDDLDSNGDLPNALASWGSFTIHLIDQKGCLLWAHHLRPS